MEQDIGSNLLFQKVVSVARLRAESRAIGLWMWSIFCDKEIRVLKMDPIEVRV